ncbi:hypothetical protein DRO54_00540 [Candidatus Bathyarchaeota archaeon]|nr:MAG: hypothetical protein DRO54_00540 [Candidatus Bathyarchaeota archaeon]
MILITTSRRPTRRIRTFCNDLARCIPNSIRINRGKLSREGLAEKAFELEADRVIVVNRWKGGPGKIELFNVEESLVGVPPLIYIRGIKLQREMGFPKSRPFSSMAITSNYALQDKEIPKLADALSNFLQVPMAKPNEIVEKKYQVLMSIRRDAMERIRVTFFKLPENREIGPRITVSHLIWSLEKPSR